VVRGRAGRRRGVTTLALSDHDGGRRRPPRPKEAAGRARPRAGAGGSRCPASTSTPKTSTSAATGSDLEAIPRPRPARARPAGAPRPGPGRSSRTCAARASRLTLDDAIREAGDADSIGRPHIAPRRPAPAATLGPFLRGVPGPGAKGLRPRAAGPSAEAGDRADPRRPAAPRSVAHPLLGPLLPRPRSRDLIRLASAPDGNRGTFYPSHSEAADRAHLLGPSARSSASTPHRVPPTTTARPHKDVREVSAPYETYGLGRANRSRPPPANRPRASVRGPDPAHELLLGDLTGPRADKDFRSGSGGALAEEGAGTGLPPVPYGPCGEAKGTVEWAGPTAYLPAGHFAPGRPLAAN